MQVPLGPDGWHASPVMAQPLLLTRHNTPDGPFLARPQGATPIKHLARQTG